MYSPRFANLLGALAVGVRDEMEAAMAAEIGLSGSTLAALLTVHTRPGQSVDGLAKVLGLSHSATVRTVDRLVGEGLIARARSGDADRRVVSLTLTSRGELAARTALDTRRHVLADALQDVDDADVAQLEDLLDKVLMRLPRSQLEAFRICRLCEHAVCRGSSCPVGRAGAAHVRDPTQDRD